MIRPPSLSISAPLPRLISSLTAGFSLVTNHIGIILFPLAIDLLLWFGPRLRLNNLLRPLADNWLAEFTQSNAANLGQSISVAQQNIHILLEQTNLLSLLSGFPVGVPSLVAGSGFMDTPIGQPLILEAATPATAIIFAVLILLVGIILGSLFFNTLSRLSAKDPQPFSLPVVLHQTVHAITLFGILFAAVILLAVPLIFMASIFVMIAPAAAQFSLTLAFFVAFWFALPFYFCAQGIFVFGQTAVNSLVTSRKLVRMFLPGVSLFILVTALLTYGLNLLWLSAPASSWMSLIGIIGHAFISSGIMAATFIYYRVGIHWLQEYMQKISSLQSRPVPPIP